MDHTSNTDEWALGMVTAVAKCESLAAIETETPDFSDSIVHLNPLWLFRPVLMGSVSSREIETENISENLGF